MVTRCCICGRPVEGPKWDMKPKADGILVADERFYYHHDRPGCRAAVQRMRKMLIQKHLERNAEERVS